MRNFNELTSLNYRLQQDKQATGEGRKEALRRKYSRRSRAVKRAAAWRLIGTAVLDVALITSLMMATVTIISLLTCVMRWLPC